MLIKNGVNCKLRFLAALCSAFMFPRSHTDWNKSLDGHTKMDGLAGAEQEKQSKLGRLRVAGRGSAIALTLEGFHLNVRFKLGKEDPAGRSRPNRLGALLVSAQFLEPLSKVLDTQL